MAESNEDVKVAEMLEATTKAMVGFTDVLKQLIDSISHLRQAVEAMAQRLEEMKNG